ncbi:MAG: hypothetical protein GWN99_05190 [Gemmatimonadetes bacterium]|uniref:Uncharacterized protein n=1 Tax=Candidatus Kutchimonas denitrificans TaxID=3056748 RepID=A0AAE5CCS7_9BACT|nr:hypothetical protein [Gemmatimonadota bacterium]NIR76080.1 hypothetical protein [Candidatus Kutchimonas denitrificans]NIS00459.1 hypothetical protein [Gemmatimonadota bacterium]NIT66117.1 hypothetical protein [Gemmatimonadota bacterium]NIU54195.1 hypothetical protein [Gemmatimonadota bacterium]
MRSPWLARLTDPGPAWVFLASALALHVVDEALHDFLATWNPIAVAVRGRLPFLPLPAFSTGVWLTGLILGLLLLFALSPFAFRRASWLRPAALFLSILMILNAAGHVLGSLYFGRVVPGTYSAPVLLLAALCLLTSALRNWAPVPSR